MTFFPKTKEDKVSKYKIGKNEIIQGDALTEIKKLPDEIIDCFITSPPYWGLRDYGVEGQLGLEKTPEEYVAKLTEIFREVKRVLKKEGTCWLNLGDSYAINGKSGGDIDLSDGMDIQRGRGRLNEHSVIKPKDLVGIPWRVAFSLQADGWYLRQDIIWAKPNPMPESVTDRCTKSHEYIFLLTKSPRYYFDNEAIKEIATGYDGRKDTMYKGGPKDMAGGKHERWKYKNLQEDGQQPNTMHEKRLVGEEYLSPVRNKRSVWTITTKPFKEAHFATFPEDLIVPMIKAGCPKGGIVLDPFIGAGTTGVVALKLDRKYIGIELNESYIKIAKDRIRPYENNLFPSKEELIKSL